MVICVDIGNSGLRLAAFPKFKSQTPNEKILWRHRCSILEPNAVIHGAWPRTDCSWFVASVNAPRLEQLQNWLQENRPRDSIRVIDYRDVPLQLQIEQPARTGIDRLIGAWSAWNKMQGQQPVVIVDAGTAVTVDYVDPTGTFVGGNIFPGTQACLRTLGATTDLLPTLDESDFPEVPFGRSTEAAIRSGVYRMQAGAIRFLVDLLRTYGAVPNENVVLTGGAISSIRELLKPEWTCDPDLVLEGIRLIATKLL